MLRMMIMMRRTTDEKALLAGQSKHQGEAAQWGRHKGRVPHTPCKAQGGRGGNSKSKTVEERFALAHHRCCCFKEAASRRCSRGGHQHENAHEAGHNEAHIWKLEYQSYDVRVVVVKSVLYVESIGHRGSTPAPGEKQAALIER